MPTSRARRRNWGAVATIAVAILAPLVGIGAGIRAQPHSTPASEPITTTADHAASAPSANPSTTPSRAGISIDLHAHSTTDPSSIWVVVNKTHPIRPLDFAPAVTIVRGYRVARPAARPLAHLLNAGDAAGLGFKIESGYRSYGYQVAIHDELAGSEGSADADRVSARAGYSEHQTGLAVDLISLTEAGCNMQACFAATPAGRWLARNAWRYGFIVRYRAGDQRITGYAPEPWHIRYVGLPLAAAMRSAGVTTLERVFHIRGGNYR